jgi:hypothetical protein
MAECPDCTNCSQDEKATKASVGAAERIEKMPAATEKLKANKNDFNKLTMTEMKSIAHVKFNSTVLTGDKAAHVATMQKLVLAQPTILNLSREVVGEAVLEGGATAEMMAVEACVEGGDEE